MGITMGVRRQAPTRSERPAKAPRGRHSAGSGEGPAEETD